MKTKIITLLTVLTLVCGLETLSAQNVGINSTGATPDASAALDINVNQKGLLIPRMSTADRNLIASPAIGLYIYNTDCNNFNYYDGIGWIPMNTNPTYIPATPGAITGTTSVCENTTGVTYSITPIFGAVSYLWNVPSGSVITSGQGTTSITVTIGNLFGNISVKQINNCGTSSESALAITVNSAPPTPGPITGLITVIAGQTATENYSIAPVSGASIYNWTLPTGATLLSGAGTTSILVAYPCNAVSGNISVTAQGTCGTSASSNLAITVSSLIASAGTAVFGGVAIGGSPTASGGTTPYTYLWGPAADLSSTTVANPTALCTGSTTTYNLTVTDANSCTATSSVVVTRNLTVTAGPAVFGGVAIGGSPTATGGNPVYTYNWSPATDLSSSTVANPTALCTGSTTTYNLTVTDANSCTKTSSVGVTRNLVANAGADKWGGAQQIGSSPTATGGNAIYTYLWSPATGLSDATVANPTATPASTTTYTVTVTDANGCTASDAMVFTMDKPMTFNFTGESKIWVVPAGVTSVTITALGAQGSGGNGGLGGRAIATVSVTPGENLYIYVGGNGGWNGGACGGVCGGGASDVRQGGNSIIPTDYRIIVAGGGGGNGNTNAGGTGGGSVGGVGSDGWAPWTTTGGGGGTQIGGGAGGGGWPAGSNGTLGSGGAGGSNGCSGGGGGGGYYGGGGGGATGCASGSPGACGGGGSGYVTGTGTSMTNGVHSGNGQITISW